MEVCYNLEFFFSIKKLKLKSGVIISIEIVIRE